MRCWWWYGRTSDSSCREPTNNTLSAHNEQTILPRTLELTWYTRHPEPIVTKTGSSHIQNHWSDGKPRDRGDVRAVGGQLRLALPRSALPRARPDTVSRSSCPPGRGESGVFHAFVQSVR